jgi:elongation factor Ts
MELIKKIRSLTGAGMVDCQKALKEANNDLDKAIEILRKNGIAKATKRTDRETNEGVIKVVVNKAGNEGYIIELNSETDFVARNEKFQKFADEVLELVRDKKPVNLEELLSLPFAESSILDVLKNLSGTIGEKMEINRFAALTGSTVAAYSHSGGKIGVLVALDKPNKADLATEIAMQVAAANPKYLRPEEIPFEEAEKERSIYKEQLIKEGKPEIILDKIIKGKMEKYYSEICLLEQEYIKEDKKKVKDILDGINILGFVRYSL